MQIRLIRMMLNLTTSLVLSEVNGVASLFRRRGWKSLSNTATSTAEIERKFHYNSSILNYCQSHASEFKSFQMVDTYYDTETLKLTTRDMWLRRRNEKLELKWPMSSDLSAHAVNDANLAFVGLDFYRESTKPPVIASVLLALAGVPVDFLNESGGGLETALTNAGINPFGTVLTERTRYSMSINLPPNLAVPHMQSIRCFVDIDDVAYFIPSTTQFTASISEDAKHYQIGEIEFDFGASVTPGEVDKGRNTAIMQHVFKVIGIHPAPVRGKMLEYLVRFRPEHYKALRNSGVLASKGL